MSDAVTWSLEEFKTSLFLYCANADFVQEEHEMALVAKLSAKSEISRIQEIFNDDGDYARIQNIMKATEHLNFDDAQKEVLFAEAKELFLVDGKFDIQEQNLFRELKRLLK